MAQLFTKGELEKKSPSELKSIITDLGGDYEGIKVKSGLVQAVLDAQEVEDEEDIEEEDIDIDEVEEEEDPEVDEDEELEEDELEEEPAPKKSKAAKKSPSAKVKEASGEDVLAAKQVATLLNIEAKTLRQFLRSSASTDEPVGSGGRYEFTEEDVPRIKTEFEKWRAEHAARGSKRGPKGSGKKAAAEVEEIEEVEEVEELEIEELDEELDDEDLELEDED